MKRFVAFTVVLLTPHLHAADDRPRPLISGLKHPSAITLGTDGKVYIAAEGEPRATGDGEVLVLDNDKAVPFARGRAREDGFGWR